MPILAWNKPAVELKLLDHPSLTTQLELRLLPDEAKQLAESLRALICEPGTELRHTVSSGWTLFWKARDSESRSLLAHPELDLWVATLALVPEHLEQVALIMETLVPHATISLADLFPLGGLSNFNLVFVAA